MAIKPTTAKGTRDFNPTTVLRRNYLMNVIKHHFELFGFMPIETPSFENANTLLGKYGEEGDRLIFKILNNGDYLKKVAPAVLQDKDEAGLTPHICDRALRYDLTVPFARYVVQHQNEITFPFKRYQIQPVWRADRPQKGRYREFTQCDADVIGTRSLRQEVDFILLYDRVFTDLKIQGVRIKLNNRKVLAGIAEVIGAADQLLDFTVALDKLDKIGVDKVKEEMRQKGITDEAIAQLSPVFNLAGDFGQQIDQVQDLLQQSVIGRQGVEELREVNRMLSNSQLKSASLSLDVTLARGLNYYTGCIFEVAPPEGIQMGSIGGGGRYDDLTGMFGLKDVSGVGISFGLDRIYLVLEELDLFPEALRAGAEVLFINFGSEDGDYAQFWVEAFRESGIKAELYPDAAKMKKQMAYADKNQVPFVILAGEDERHATQLTVKNMQTGTQDTLPAAQVLEQLKGNA